jgi:hypothetical protein
LPMRPVNAACVLSAFGNSNDGHKVEALEAGLGVFDRHGSLPGAHGSLVFPSLYFAQAFW